MLDSLENLGVQNITSYVLQTELNLPNADSGGTANVYRGTYTRPTDHTVTEVAIKVIRAGNHGSRPEGTAEKVEKGIDCLGRFNSHSTPECATPIGRNRITLKPVSGFCQ
ncbi:hypothetical protein FRC12_011521 [Ceratobasidium sp. 428]|nr:hypothetical protein FRC12_011521 [Ceratobasidium sp. 428]